MFQNLTSGLPWLHILVATIGYFVLGAIWYSFLFQKPWIRGHKIDMNNPEAKKGVAGVMVISFVLQFLICTGIAVVLKAVPPAGIGDAVETAAFVGFFFAFLTTSVSYMYLQKPFVIHLIDGLYNVVGMMIAAAILTAWK
ncbi:MAG: hypothetical protein JWN76_3493 [Chitinophagaceae bacterium]|nr:hypothetical protein [Chitinophagaceae bacterium]